MRHITICLALLMGALASWADPVMKFDKTSHDFGRINAEGGTVTATYPFTNTGDKPLIIITVTNGGCGCTKPTFPTKPIAPGEKGEITITFDPKGRAGDLNRKVLVQTNMGAKRIGLTFKGVVIPKWKDVPTNPK